MSEKVPKHDVPGSESSPARPEPRMECPMASMCGRMFERATSRFLLMLPGAVLILLGVAILIEPQVLAWLVAGVAVLLGVTMLLMATFMARLAARAAGR